MTTLTALRQVMTEFLEQAGVEALTAWPKGSRWARREPVAVVQVKEVEASAAGFQNYLGQVYDQETRQWTERYGQRVTVRFAIALYSPETAGEEGCRKLLDQVAEAFLQGEPGGFAVEKWSMGESDFDRDSGMFRGKLQAVCRGTLVAVTEETGEITGFTVKGDVVV